MLALPTSGLSQPTGTLGEIKHNVKLDLLCDWIEGSVLFDEETLSIAEVVDILSGEGIYDDPDLALEIVTTAWDELKRRLEWIGKGSPFSITRRSVRKEGTWEETPAHSFCVLLSLPQCYEDWVTCLSPASYVEQGRLFECLAKASVEYQFSDWEVLQTGWSRMNTVRFPDLVHKIANRLGEQIGQIEPWENENTKDAGLDLLFYRPFPDRRVGVPVYLMQCASGENWIDKLHMPNLNTWTKLIVFAAAPKKHLPFLLHCQTRSSKTVAIWSTGCC